MRDSETPDNQRTDRMIRRFSHTRLWTGEDLQWSLVHHQPSGEVQVIVTGEVRRTATDLTHIMGFQFLGPSGRGRCSSNRACHFRSVLGCTLVRVPTTPLGMPCSGLTMEGDTGLIRLWTGADPQTCLGLTVPEARVRRKCGEHVLHFPHLHHARRMFPRHAGLQEKDLPACHNSPVSSVDPTSLCQRSPWPQVKRRHQIHAGPRSAFKVCES